MTVPPRFRLSILGAFALTAPDGASRKPGKTQQALLAALALARGEARSREHLASLLWHDRGDAQARHSLRQSVLTLRKLLDDSDEHLIRGDAATLSLNPDLVSVDALEFEALARETSSESLARAGALYRGDLLSGLAIPSEAFEEWLTAERARWRRIAIDVLQRLAAQQVEAGHFAPAVRAAQHAIEIDPLDEASHRLLMRAHAARGRRSEALKVYRDLTDLLRRDLGTAPDQATVGLAETIRAEPQDAHARRKASATAEEPDQRSKTSQAAEGVRTLEARPTLLVLPFRPVDPNSVADPLADALTEDIAAGVSAVSNIAVFSPLTILETGAPVPDDESKIAAHFGVRYVLEGKLQRAEDQVRFWVRLTDRNRGQQIWAERFSGATADILALQDRITMEVLTALQVEITEGEQARTSHARGTRNLEAWLAAGQGLQLLRRASRANAERARDLYRRAAQHDALYPAAWEGLAWTHLLAVQFGWSEDRQQDLDTAAELAHKAQALDRGRGRTYSLLGAIALLRGECEEAIAAAERAIALAPQDSEPIALLAYTLSHCGDVERAAALIDTAIGLSPYPPLWYRWTLARIRRLQERFDEAIAILSDHLDERSPSKVPRLELVLALAEAGRGAEARARADEILRIDPFFTVGRWLAASADRDAARKDKEARHLRRIGLPA
ncbi:MAG: BTAD domain-containing putative transcriptional regulator [Alphaproteobacteria bacterium]